MKAIRLHEHGGPEVLRYEDVPTPEPKPGEVLVRVHAAGVNPPDWYVRDGMTTMPGETETTFAFPMTPGTDVSGVVESAAGDFAAGDEVFGMVRFPSFTGGGYAEYITAPTADLARKPAGLDHVRAAGVPMAALTAWQYLIEPGHDHPSPFQARPHRPVPIGQGTTVLVNGAAGGVGHFAVQLAKWQGARVIAVASGGHEEFLRELGADEFIDYTRARPAEVARDLDLVLDTVGGPAGREFLGTLKPGGALFPVFYAEFDADEVARHGVTVSAAQVRSNGAQLAELGRLLADGTVRVAIDSTCPLAEARAAHERAARGHLRGKIVLTVA
ncbi:NADPH:quinone reductase-like Zn-dependent oxidoreductase [Catenuloplanes nepalensis]|uniref:NADPH:quinone reductase-like Zn-dependent oxidoreductase n=1 Tax=Catenuloplanes nepalensis TaxID=587533 RepID=A0ABT9N8M9_9ACTN|nr:NADP-dependent oxidoreductase [Catenuloplanes nepalensis]MDP9799893.1 NADPH:quinone reductase-like Zn-dependent oxidoreductase [Catenuloplanes nepalensis]